MHFCCEGGVADRQHLVDEHDVGVGLDHHREGEPDHHPRRVVLQLQVDELAQLGEVEHGVEPAARLAAARPIITPLSTTFSRAVSSGLKPTPSSMNGRQPAGHPDRPRVGAVDAGEDLQQRALARSRCGRRSRRTRPGGRRRRCRAARAARDTRRARERVQRALFERVDPWVGMRNVFDVAHLDRPDAVASTGARGSIERVGRCRARGATATRGAALRRRPPAAQPLLVEAGRRREARVADGPARPGAPGAQVARASATRSRAPARSRCPSVSVWPSRAARAGARPATRRPRASARWPRSAAAPAACAGVSVSPAAHQQRLRLHLARQVAVEVGAAPARAGSRSCRAAGGAAAAGCRRPT